MSDSDCDSDISEFAAWEAEHPSQVLEESERERSLADMARPEREQVWGDRDSSNDARSSDEEAGANLSKSKRQVVETIVDNKVVIEIPSSSASEADSEDEVRDTWREDQRGIKLIGL